MTQAVLKLVWPASSNKTYIWPVEDSALKCRLQTSVLCDTSHCHDCCFLWDTLTHIVCDITFTRLPWDMSHWHDYTAVMWNKIYSSHVVWCVTSHIDITVAAVSCLTHQTTWLLCILCHMTTLYLVSQWHDCRVSRVTLTWLPCVCCSTKRCRPCPCPSPSPWGANGCGVSPWRESAQLHHGREERGSSPWDKSAAGNKDRGRHPGRLTADTCHLSYLRHLGVICQGYSKRMC